MNIQPINPHIDATEIAPERLAHNNALSEQQKIGEASRRFEGVLLKQILDASQKTVIQSKYADNSTASGIYHDMVTTQLADSISKSGSFGLAKSFDKQLERHTAASPKLLDAQASTLHHHTVNQSTVNHAASRQAQLSPHSQLSKYSQHSQPTQPSHQKKISAAHPAAQHSKSLHERTIAKSH